VASALATGEIMPDPDLATEKAIVLEHYHAMLSHFGAHPGLRLARKHVSWYSSGLPGSAQFRAAVNRIDDGPQALALIEAFYNRQIENGGIREKSAERGTELREDLAA
jgi:tRNA-dihydrouridine synthase B